MNIENKNRPNWWVITTLVGCVSLIACACCYVLGSLGVLVYLVSDLPPMPRPLVMVTPGPTLPKPTSTIRFAASTSTPVPDTVLLTRTAKFEAIDTANAISTATAIVHQPTLQAAQTLAAALVEDPTQWTVEEVIADLPPAFGPENGWLDASETNYPFYSSDVKAKNFVVQVRLNNPEQLTWGYSLNAPDPYCYFVLSSSGKWEFSAISNGWYRNAYGQSEIIDSSAYGSNLVQMVALDETVVVYVNRVYIGTFKSELPTIIGEIQLETGPDLLPNVEYSFSDFTVWVLP